MIVPLLTMRVRTRRDVLKARQRARQIAALLGFDVHERTTIAALVFEVACNARGTQGRIEFQLNRGLLRIFPAGTRARSSRKNRRPPQTTWDVRGARRLVHKLREGASQTRVLRLDQRLPERTGTLAHDDLPWMVRQLAKLSPLDVFEEIRLQNQEVLRCLEERYAKTGPAASRTRKKPAA
jgi:hypothetical protein